MRDGLLAGTLLCTAAAVPASGAEWTITMQNMAYAPTRIEAETGDVLHFVNDGAATHAVFVPTAGHALDLGPMEPGEERRLVLRGPGTFEVECVFHPEMHLDVVVQ